MNTPRETIEKILSKLVVPCPRITFNKIDKRDEHRSKLIKKVIEANLEHMHRIADNEVCMKKKMLGLFK